MASCERPFFNRSVPHSFFACLPIRFARRPFVRHSRHESSGVLFGTLIIDPHPGAKNRPSSATKETEKEKKGDDERRMNQSMKK
jgi:hypothetical protein